ncbi:MAG: beta-L-arabinofuranosidase domain-containing protein [Chitinophagaceae bacterium]
MKIVILSILIVLSYGCKSVEKNQKKSRAYQGPAVVYYPLNVGAIKPDGWLLDWANAAANGITGHLNENSTVFKKGWSGESFEAFQAGPQGTNWPLEQSAYWLDGLVKLAYILDDSVLIQKARARLDPIVKGVLNGGPSFIYWRPKNQLDITFENWAHSHIGRAMVGYYSATRDPSVLKALVKVYTAYTYPELIRKDFLDVNGMVNIDPIVETWLFSKDAGVLSKALELSDKPNLKNLISVWNKGNFEVGHGVIYYENIRVPAILSTINHNTEYLNASIKALEWGEKDNLLPIGLISAEEYMAGIGSTRNVETCNITSSSNTLNWLLRITGKSSYSDKIEQIFFNAGPAPVSRDFKTMCYYQSPNRISTELPKECPQHPSGGGSYTFTEIGHPVLCCVGNTSRIIPNYVINMWMKTGDNDLAAVLYGPNVLTTEINGIPVKIKSRTNYPFEENIQMAMVTEKKNNFSIHFKIPGWCDNPVIKVNNKQVNVVINDLGFALISKTWESGDKIDLVFPMKVKVLQGRETNYADINYFTESEKSRGIARTKEKINNPYSSVFYGPLLFALPIPDNGPNETGLQVPFNFALNLVPDKINEKTEIARHEMTRPWHWQPENPPVTITVPAVQFDWKPTELQPLPANLINEGKDTIINLVPYNITKFRVSMFPVAASAWNKHFSNE